MALPFTTRRRTTVPPPVLELGGPLVAGERVRARDKARGTVLEVVVELERREPWVVWRDDAGRVHFSAASWLERVSA
jgi:hypothetical protein